MSPSIRVSSVEAISNERVTKPAVLVIGNIFGRIMLTHKKLLPHIGLKR